jgi:uncharacterized repeat protein (TIGR01451 family)
MFGVVSGTAPFVLTVRARILAYEGTAPGGFFFGVRTASPNQEYGVLFTPSGVTDGVGNGVAINTTVFHTYVLRATPGGPYTLDIDGHFAFGGPFSATGGALNAVQFGDGASLGPTNARAEVTQFDYSQGGAQLTLSNTNKLNFPVGEHGRYMLNVENTGAASTTDPITVKDTLPAGLIFDTGAGSNWTCSAGASTAGVPQDVTCTNPGPLAPGDSATIDMVVKVDASSFCQGSAGCWDIVNNPPTVTNTATVATTGFPGQTATDDTRVCKPSGPDWATNSPWPEDKAPNDLSTSPVDFQGDVKSFVKALRNARDLHGRAHPADVGYITTYRAPQRAYLMHFSGVIAGGMNPTDPSVTPFPEGDSHFSVERQYPLYHGPDTVNICWVHTDDQGEADTGTSRTAAKAMLKAYKIGHGAAFPTNHSLGDAVDMSITWAGIIKVIVPGHVPGTTTLIQMNSQDQPIVGKKRCLDDNPDLVKAGKAFLVLKLLTDCHHWSTNGR